MSPSKKSVNVRIDPALLHEARHQDINLSATLEGSLPDRLRQDRRERWLVGNKSAIDAYNRQIDTHGAFAGTLRSF
jgi:post-segregation antitoxin (ccd killing protein)